MMTTKISSTIVTLAPVGPNQYSSGRPKMPDTAPPPCPSMPFWNRERNFSIRLPLGMPLPNTWVAPLSRQMSSMVCQTLCPTRPMGLSRVVMIEI